MNSDFQSTPIVIICRDRLAPLRALLGWLDRAGYERPILLDNASSYPPLVDFLSSAGVEVVRLSRNLGHLAPWASGEIRSKIEPTQPFVVTDCDVVPDEGCPSDAVEHLAAVLQAHGEVEKVGLGLRIDDLPDSYALKQQVIEWESQFWELEIAPGVFEAEVDTTFALYRSIGRRHSSAGALRTGPPYVARHLPWYGDSSNPTDEQEYYREHADRSLSHWETDREGENIRRLVKKRDRQLAGRKSTTQGDELPHCVVVIPTYNGAALTVECLKTLLANPPSHCRWTIVVVDDGSIDGTPEALARFAPEIVLVRQDTNTGFAGACNAGARAAGDSDYVVFLNNDTLPMPGWLDALVEEAASDKQIAAVGAKLLYPNGQVQHAGVAIHQNGLPHHLYAGFESDHPAVNRARNVTAATAACLLVRRTDFDELGGFDTAFHNAYEDVDLCLRLGESGLLIRYCPRSVVIHLESVTRFPSGVPEGTQTSDRVYDERWRSRVVPDDIQHYIDDGLISFEWAAHYPMKLSVSPDLAVVARDADELIGMERLLAHRSLQVLELSSAQTRRRLKDRAGPPRPVLSASSTARIERVLDGREHRLGQAGSGRLISVVIPVKNGAPYLEELLTGVLAQSISARLEIVAIDSGSRDGTLDLLERFGATAFAIEPSEFDHGLTRNLAAEHAHGEILVFLTQRARPVGDRWLAPLISALEEDPAVAGACSRLLPRPEADLLARKDVEQELCASPVRQRKQIDDWTEYSRMPAEERRRFLNFHTVSAAIRAEALRRYPFRSVRTIGEDLLWAREVVESGWALVHEPASIVSHSHDYTLSELFGRNVDDGIANRDIIDRSFDGEEIVARIRATVEEDWSYLRETLGLAGSELEHWQFESVLRRAAQVVGQWVGVNYETLPEDTAARFSNVAQIRADSPPGAEEG
jgi:GT2 family glycosyltransferase